MKIITWNVNGIRAVHRKNMLYPLLDKYSPDVLMLQETKGNIEQFPEDLVNPLGYFTAYNSAEKKGYSGTAQWISHDLMDRISYPESKLPQIFTEFKGDPVHHEGRMVRADFDIDQTKFSLLSIYFPNGGKSEAAWKDKLVFYSKMLDYVNEIHDAGRICIWGGDVNCAHQEIDLALPRENDGKIGFHPLERQWIDQCINNDWIDVFRYLNPEKKNTYSWWHMITKARERNVGWRIDYFFLKKEFASMVKSIEYIDDYMGSDHCPLMMEIE